MQAALVGQYFDTAPEDELLLEELLDDELLELELLLEDLPELELLEELLLELELLDDELLLELELLDEGSATHPLNKMDPNKVRHSADNRGEVRMLVFQLLLF